MDTTPQSGSKRPPSTSPSAAITPFPKRHAASYSSTPFKDPLRQNSDFSSPIFNRSLDFVRNEPASMNANGGNLQFPNSRTLAQDQVLNELQESVPSQFQPSYDYPAPGSQNGLHSFNADPAMSMQNTQTNSFSAGVPGTFQHQTLAPMDSNINFSSPSLTADPSFLPTNYSFNPPPSYSNTGGNLNSLQYPSSDFTGVDFSYPDQNSQLRYQHPGQDQYLTLPAQSSDLGASEQRQLIPVVSRNEVEALGGTGQYQHVNISGVDDGENGMSSVSSLTGDQASVKAEDVGAESEEDDDDEVFVDAEEEISAPDDDEERNDLKTEHEELEAADNLAEELGLRRDQYEYLRMSNWRVEGIIVLATGEEYSFYPPQARDRDSLSDEGSIHGQDAEPGENRGIDRQPKEADDSDDEGEKSDVDSEGEQKQQEDDNSDAATNKEEEEASVQAHGEDDQASSTAPNDELEPTTTAPQDDIIDLVSDSEDDGLYSKYFKKTPPKSSLNNNTSPAPTSSNEQASYSFSGGPSSQIKSLPGTHTTRISTSTSPPPPTRQSSSKTSTSTSSKPSSTQTITTWRRHPDIVRDLSRPLLTHQKLHTLALDLIPTLPNYQSLNWTRRYWIAVLLHSKRPTKSSFSSKEFIWMKGNVHTTVETVWNAYQTSTMADPEEVRLVLGGAEGVEEGDEVGEMDYFGDKFVVFCAVGKGVAEVVEGRGLVEGLVPRGTVEVVDLVEDDDEEEG